MAGWPGSLRSDVAVTGTAGKAASIAGFAFSQLGRVAADALTSLASAPVLLASAAPAGKGVAGRAPGTAGVVFIHPTLLEDCATVGGPVPGPEACTAAKEW